MIIKDVDELDGKGIPEGLQQQHHREQQLDTPDSDSALLTVKTCRGSKCRMLRLNTSMAFAKTSPVPIKFLIY